MAEKIKVPLIRRGVLEGLSPFSDNETFPPEYGAQCLNLRPTNGRWAPRYGQSLYYTFTPGAGGSGRVLAGGNIYTSTGYVHRWVEIGSSVTTYAHMYHRRFLWTQSSVSYVDQDSAWVETKDKDGNRVNFNNGIHGIQGVTIRDRFYLTDRNGQMYSYHALATAPNFLYPVEQPDQPSTKPYVWTKWDDVLEDWSPFSWSVTQEGNATAIAVADNDDPSSPLRGARAKLTFENAGSDGDLAYRDFTTTDIESSTVAFLFNQTGPPVSKVSVKVGQTSNEDVVARVPISPFQTDRWEPLFIQVGELEAISRVEFEIEHDADEEETSLFISKIVLPGRLDGEYRWRYTYYNSVTERESKPSDPSQVVDFTVDSSNPDRLQPFKRIALLSANGNAPTGVDTVRWWRNGGSPGTTKDENGQDLWLLVGERDAFKLQVAVYSATQLDILGDYTSVLNDDDWIVINQYDHKYREFAKIDTVTFTGVYTRLFLAGDGLNKTHSAGEYIEPAYRDNTSDSEIASAERLDLYRDDPPDGTMWLARGPEGRMWIFGTDDDPMACFASSLPGPNRKNDHEVFPRLSPFINRDPLQGWKFNIQGEKAGDAIMWGGFFQGMPFVLTRTGGFRVYANSQVNWGANSVTRVTDIGCIAGNTVQEVNGRLYWVAPGPRVVRWDGTSPPQIISYPHINERLRDASAGYWFHAWAVGHQKEDGHYYQLYYVNADADTRPRHVFHYHTELDAWYEAPIYDNSQTRQRISCGWVQDGPNDRNELILANGRSLTTHYLYKADDPTVTYDYITTELHALTNQSNTAVPIRISAKTKWFDMGMISQVCRIALRFTGTTPGDQLRLTVKTAGGDAEEITEDYYVDLSGDQEKWIDVQTWRGLQGRYVMLELHGDWWYRPMIRDIEIHYLPLRHSRGRVALGSGDA